MSDGTDPSGGGGYGEVVLSRRMGFYALMWLVVFIGSAGGLSLVTPGSRTEMALVPLPFLALIMCGYWAYKWTQLSKARR